jgi:preprotein translocase subunit Sec61beta
MPLRSIANLIGFQSVWAACVLFAAAGRPWLGVAVLAGVIGLHLMFPVAPVKQESKLLAVAAALGLAGEWALHALAVTGYPPQVWTGEPIPAWMIALWVNFAATLHSSLAWLEDRFVLATMLGAVAGPLSYWGGERLGAIALYPNPVVWIAGVGLLWAVATPFLVWYAAEGKA